MKVVEAENPLPGGWFEEIYLTKEDYGDEDNLNSKQKLKIVTDKAKVIVQDFNDYNPNGKRKLVEVRKTIGGKKSKKTSSSTI